jgi:hypothetical protein
VNVREQIAALREEFQQAAAASREDTARVVALLMRALSEMPQPSPDRWKERSRTLPGIADAMAEQWGNAILASMTPSAAPCSAFGGDNQTFHPSSITD